MDRQKRTLRNLVTKCGVNNSNPSALFCKSTACSLTNLMSSPHKKINKYGLKNAVGKILKISVRDELQRSLQRGRWRDPRSPRAARLRSAAKQVSATFGADANACLSTFCLRMWSLGSPWLKDVTRTGLRKPPPLPLTNRTWPPHRRKYRAFPPLLGEHNRTFLFLYQQMWSFHASPPPTGTLCLLGDDQWAALSCGYLRSRPMTLKANWTHRYALCASGDRKKRWTI